MYRLPLATHRGRLAPQKRPKKVAICSTPIWKKTLRALRFARLSLFYFRSASWIILKHVHGVTPEWRISSLGQTGCRKNVPVFTKILKFSNNSKYRLYSGTLQKCRAFSIDGTHVWGLTSYMSIICRTRFPNGQNHNQGIRIFLNWRNGKCVPYDYVKYFYSSHQIISHVKIVSSSKSLTTFLPITISV